MGEVERSVPYHYVTEYQLTKKVQSHQFSSHTHSISAPIHILYWKRGSVLIWINEDFSQLYHMYDVPVSGFHSFPVYSECNGLNQWGRFQQVGGVTALCIIQETIINELTHIWNRDTADRRKHFRR